MAVSLLTKMLRSGQPSYCCVPQSVVDSITCNIQRAHHPLLPIMFLRHQCLISPQLFILALHILYFLMDTHITYSLPSIMHQIKHSIIRFFSFKCTSFFTLVTLLILTQGHIISSIALIAHFCRFIQIFRVPLPLL
ncbi:hypothetical protein BDR04DRAFT_1087311, partial [Suillus decipiens]